MARVQQRARSPPPTPHTSEDHRKLLGIWDTAGTVQYRRIRIISALDVEALYPLIAAYVAEPNLAHSVEEIALATDIWSWEMWNWKCDCSESDTGFNSSPGAESYSRAIDEDGHAAMASYARGLGLSPEDTEGMVSRLNWKRDCLRGLDTHGGRLRQVLNKEWAVAATVLLFSLCPNVKTIFAGEADTGATSQFLARFLLRSNYGMLPREALQTLESVKVAPGSHYHERCEYESTACYFSTIEPLDYVRAFHHLLQIKTLEMEGVSEYQNDFLLFPPGTSSFRSVRIQNSYLSYNLLGVIIRSSERLEEFEYSLGGLAYQDAGLVSACPKTLGKSLLQHKNWLQVLDLDIDADMPAKWEDEDERVDDDDHPDDEYFAIDLAKSSGPLHHQDLEDGREFGYTIGSLSEFTALRRLSIGFTTLTGMATDRWVHGQSEERFRLPFRLVDALPPNLEYLCFYGYRPNHHVRKIEDIVEEFLEDVKVRFPRLEVVGLDEQVLGPGSKYGYELVVGEDEFWQRPKYDWEWATV
ncbi:F-box domain containing protein [Colletotrichum plurivorum]|uniref:F-box domain containing protein n=1 Tax=Colletotrichum plurivorum TaxID=2175906 RepID=A0A8H6JYN2_9PEZI|nr:F-box domain containing protein [Colletotrichum plurivorum]